jgi:dipeptidase E
MADGRVGALERYILGLCASERPRVCFLPTASGDSDGLVTRFYEAFADADCEPSHVALFRPHPEGVAERLLAADAIYVGGGSTVNLIAIWEAHALGAVLRRAWEGGTVLSGVSAGAICWFEWGITDSLGAGYAPVRGLGFAPGGFCPHADGDPARVPALREMVGRGAMPPTLAVDDGAAVHLMDGELQRVVVTGPGLGARRVGPGGTSEDLEGPAPALAPAG